MTKVDELPKISVVTPSFRQEQFLETAILSVLGQCYPNLEYLVMDGGSDDGSVAVIERYAGDLAFWQSKSDEGQADAINQGFARATGDILCWVNSDDFLLPGTLRKIARLLGSRVNQPALIYGSSLYFCEENGSARVFKARPFDRSLLCETDYIYQPSTFWTRSLWERTGPLDSQLHFGFDWDWYLRASLQGEFLVCDEILSGYRQHAGHKSGSGGESRRMEILEVVQRHGTSEQITAYRYAMAKFDMWERRNGVAAQFARWRVPYASTVAHCLTPALWTRPTGLSSMRLRRCWGMLAPN